MARSHNWHWRGVRHPLAMSGVQFARYEQRQESDITAVKRRTPPPPTRAYRKEPPVEYRGFRGEVVFDDYRYVIRLMGTDSTVECQSRGDIADVFAELVEDTIRN